MSFEDMGLVRGLANSVVLEVADAAMFKDILGQLAMLEGFYWVRTVRKQAVKVYGEGSHFTLAGAHCRHRVFFNSLTLALMSLRMMFVMAHLQRPLNRS
jgi:hypothetical protein